MSEYKEIHYRDNANKHLKQGTKLAISIIGIPIAPVFWLLAMVEFALAFHHRTANNAGDSKQDSKISDKSSSAPATSNEDTNEQTRKTESARLEELEELYDKGMITDDEYENKRESIIEDL